jgi:hypothetical protein
MLGISLKKDEVSSPIQDVLVIMSSDGTADIAPIIEINEERILATGEDEVDYAVPIGDAKLYIGRRGRIYTYPASDENVFDVKRIAALEKSTVLKQITLFEKETAAPDVKLPIGKIILVAAVVLIFIIILAVRK